MKHLVYSLAVLLATASVVPVIAQDAEPAPSAAPNPENAVKTLADLGAGVHKVKTEKVESKNVLKSCVIVGQARISTTLGLSKGLIVAQRNAKLSAESEFVSWMKTQTSSVRSSGDQTEYCLKGEGDGENYQESATSVETSAETITSAAQGAIRGMTLMGKYQDSETKTLYLVFAWKPDFAVVAADAEGTMNIPATTKSPASASPSKEKPSKKGPVTVPEKNVSDPALNEFL